MNPDLLDILICPDCGNRLSFVDRVMNGKQVEAGQLTCSGGHVWQIEDGVAAFTREDAPSDPWSRSFKDFEKFVRNKEYSVPRAAERVRPIIEQIMKAPDGFHLDVCTGDGMLLYNLKHRIDPERQIVSLDHSLHAQKYNHRYAKENDLLENTSFVAADAASLPFKTGSFSSFGAFAISNMMEKMPDGISEGARVLVKGGRMALNLKFVDEDSEGWRRMLRGLTESGVSGDVGFLGMEDDVTSLVESLNLTSHSIEVLSEVIGDPDRDVEAGPIFPYPNERLQEVLVAGMK